MSSPAKIGEVVFEVPAEHRELVDKLSERMDAIDAMVLRLADERNAAHKRMWSVLGELYREKRPGVEAKDRDWSYGDGKVFDNGPNNDMDEDDS